MMNLEKLILELENELSATDDKRFAPLNIGIKKFRDCEAILKLRQSIQDSGLLAIHLADSECDC
jgi:hypothetical protein